MCVVRVLYRNLKEVMKSVKLVNIYIYERLFVIMSVCVSSCLNTKAFEQEILENKIY